MKRTKRAISVLCLLAIFGGGGYFLLHTITERQVQKSLNALVRSGRVAGFHYDKLVTGLPGQVSIHQLVLVSPEAGETLIQRLNVNHLDLFHQFPHSLDVEARGVSLARSYPGQKSGNFEATTAHLNRLLQSRPGILNVHFKYLYQPQEDHAVKSKLSLHLAQSLNLEVDSEALHLPLDELMDDELNTEAFFRGLDQAMTKIALPRLQASLQDQGIVDTFIALEAADNGLNKEDFRQHLSSQLLFLSLLLPQQMGEFSNHLSRSLNAFLEGGKTLSISLEPAMNGHLQSLEAELIALTISGDIGSAIDLLQPSILTH